MKPVRVDIKGNKFEARCSQEMVASLGSSGHFEMHFDLTGRLIPESVVLGLVIDRSSHQPRGFVRS
jgi:hypothetical protein